LTTLSFEKKIDQASKTFGAAAEAVRSEMSEKEMLKLERDKILKLIKNNQKADS
jgi:hypothetical protein